VGWGEEFEDGLGAEDEVFAGDEVVGLEVYFLGVFLGDDEGEALACAVFVAVGEGARVAGVLVEFFVGFVVEVCGELFGLG